MKKVILFFVMTLVVVSGFSNTRPHLQLGLNFGLNGRAYNIKTLIYAVGVTVVNNPILGTSDTTIIMNDTIVKLKGSDGGYHAGFFLRVYLKRKYGEIGANFNRTSAPTFGGIGTDSTASSATAVYGVEIPFLVGYKIVDKPIFKWRVNTGLNLGIIGKVKENPQEFERKDFTNPRVGMRFGTGIDVAFFAFDIYYTLGLTKEFKSVDIRTQSHFLQLNVGVLF